jgi:hypothetical protein
MKIDPQHAEAIMSPFLDHYEAELRTPFPYDGCRKVCADIDPRICDGFIPALDLFMWDVDSACGGIKKVLQFDADRLRETRASIAQSFAERHPEYKMILNRADEIRPEDLWVSMQAHEEMRVRLLTLINDLLWQKGEATEAE